MQRIRAITIMTVHYMVSQRSSGSMTQTPVYEVPDGILPWTVCCLSLQPLRYTALSCMLLLQCLGWLSRTPSLGR